MRAAVARPLLGDTRIRAGLTVAAGVAVGVIGLRWHYFTDCVAGAALGAGTVLTLALLIDLAPAVVSRARKLPAGRTPLPREAGPVATASKPAA